MGGQRRIGRSRYRTGRENLEARSFQIGEKFFCAWITIRRKFGHGTISNGAKEHRQGIVRSSPTPAAIQQSLRLIQLMARWSAVAVNLPRMGDPVMWVCSLVVFGSVRLALFSFSEMRPGRSAIGEP